MPLSPGSYVQGSRTVDGDGSQWVVRQASWIETDGRTCPCLIFETEGVVRCVRACPADWRTCPDAALFALSLAF